MEIQLGKLPATHQTWRHKAFRELFNEIVSNYPDETEDQWRCRFRLEGQEDEDYYRSMADYAFDSAIRAWTEQKERQPLSAKERADRAKDAAIAAEEHAKKVEFVKEQIITLNLEMPNGKRLRYCTLDYLYRLGGAFKAVGKKGDQKLIGQIYDEEQFRAKLKGLT